MSGANLTTPGGSTPMGDDAEKADGYPGSVIDVSQESRAVVPEQILESGPGPLRS